MSWKTAKKYRNGRPRKPQAFRTRTPGKKLKKPKYPKMKRGLKEQIAFGEAYRRRLFAISRSAIDSATDEAAADTKGYLESLGWDAAQYTQQSIDDVPRELDFSTKDIEDLVDIIDKEIRTGGIKILAAKEKEEDWKGGISVQGEVNILESDEVSDYVSNFVAGKLNKILKKKGNSVGKTLAEKRVLNVMRGYEVSTHYIANKLNISDGAANKILTKLKKRGLVERAYPNKDMWELSSGD